MATLLQQYQSGKITASQYNAAVAPKISTPTPTPVKTVTPTVTPTSTSSGGGGSSAPSTQNAAFNPNNGQPLYAGQTITFQGKTYVGTTVKPTPTSTPTSTSTPAPIPSSSTSGIYPSTTPANQALADFQSGKITSAQYNTWAATQTSTSTVTPPASSTTLTTQPSNVINFDPNTGKQLTPGQTVTYNGQTYTQGQPLGSQNGVIPPATSPIAPITPITPPSPYSPTNQTYVTPELTKLLGVTSNLTPGMSGSDVTALQTYLISQGLNIPSGATGYYGDETKAAVTEWQKKNNIQPASASDYGYFGPKSMAFLKQQGTPTPTDTGTTGLEPTTGPSTNPDPAVADQQNTIYSILKNQYGLDYTPETLQAAFQYNPGQSYQQILIDVMTSLGLVDIKTHFDDITTKINAIDAEKQKKIEAVNSNPWLSEGLRAKRVSAIESSYATKKSDQVDTLNLLEKQYNDGLQQAENAANKTLDVYNKEFSAQTDLLKTLVQDAQKQINAEATAKAKTTSTTDKLLTVAEAKTLGVPYGTTQSQASQMGITPTAPTKTTTTSTKPINIGTTTVTQDEINRGKVQLDQARGTDGYTDPNLFKAMYDAWLKAGGTADTFIKYYPPKNYINPAPQSTPLPAILRTGVSTSTAGRTL